MKNSLLLTVVIISVILDVGCTSTQNSEQAAQPDWVVGESSKYPKALYLTGQGSGETMGLAKQYARSDLAKIFEVEISETSRDVQTVEMDNNSSTMQAQAERYISTNVHQILSGVEVAEAWQDPNTRRYHALATLHRDKTARALQEDIRLLDEASALYIQKARQEIDRLRLAAYAYKAYAAQLERAVIQKKLRIVDLAGIGNPPQLELAKLKADYEQVLGRIHIIAQSSDQYIEDLVSAGLFRSGFNANPEEPNRYVLKASLETVPVIRRAGFYWAQAAINFQLQESNPSAKVRGSDRWEIKVSATDEGLLEKRLNDELGQLKKHKYRDMILMFAFN